MRFKVTYAADTGQSVTRDHFDSVYSIAESSGVLTITDVEGKVWQLSPSHWRVVEEFPEPLNQ
jgi:hypothetical protein